MMTASSNLKVKGFTLIELVVTILVISIMAVTIVPRVLSSKGFEEYTYRDELITKLRAIQLRFMHQSTLNSVCRQIGTTTKSIGLRATTPNTTTNECQADVAGQPTFHSDTTSVIISADHNNSFTYSESLTSFSQLGRPLGCAVVNPCRVTITISGETNLQVEINSEGFIYEL